MNTKLYETFTWRKVFVHILGLFIFAFGVCTVTATGLGTLPITSVAYLFSLITGHTLGVTQFLMNMMLLGLQICLLGKEFRKSQFMQIPVALIFSFYLDFLMPPASIMTLAVDGIFYKVIMFAMALVILAFGLSLMLNANVIMLPADSFNKVVAYRTKWSFGKAKVLVDCLMVMLTCGISLPVYHKLVGVQVGTVVLAATLGNLARIFSMYTQTVLVRFFESKKIESAEEPEE